MNPPAASRARTDQDPRRSIGLFIYGVESTYASLLWPAVNETCRAHDIDLYIFPAKMLNSPWGLESQLNSIYEMAPLYNLDAIIINAGLFPHLTESQIYEYFDRFKEIPLVSSGIGVPGVPSVVVDNKQGVKETVRHLIEVHNCKKIANVRGPVESPEANQRFDAFIETLEEYGLPFSDDWLQTGDFTQKSGSVAVESLLSHSPTNFDAVVFANDEMLSGAMGVFQHHNIKLPHDLAVVGFDNIPLYHLSMSFTLTTVVQPIYDLGQKSAELAIAIINGQEVPEVTELSAYMTVGASCGCRSNAYSISNFAHLKSRISNATTTESIEHRTMEKVYPVLSFIEDGTLREIISVETQVLLQRLAEYGNLETLIEHYLNDIYILFNKSIHSGDPIGIWQKLLNVINAYILTKYPANDSGHRIKITFQKSRILLGEIVKNKEDTHAYWIFQDTRTINQCLKKISSKLTIDELAENIRDVLDDLEIPLCEMYLFEEPFEFSTYLEFEASDREVSSFIEHNAVPSETDVKSGGTSPLSQTLVRFKSRLHERAAIIDFPLFCGNVHFGIIQFKLHGMNISMYESLALHIGNMVKFCTVLAEEKQKRIELEQKIVELNQYFNRQKQTQIELVEATEKAASANDLKSKYIVNLSHKLRTPLSIIINNSDLLAYDAISSREDIYEILKSLKTGMNSKNLQSQGKDAPQIIPTVDKLMTFIEEDTCDYSIVSSELRSATKKHTPILNEAIHDTATKIDEYNSLETTEFSKAYEQIKQSSYYLLKLIDATLNIQDLVKNNVKVDYQVVNIQRFINAIVTNGQSYLRSAGKGEKIELRTEIKLEDHIRGFFDDQKIQQVMLNLVSNAIKFTNQGSITITVNLENDDLHFKVHDTGLGIRDAEKSVIFKEYGRTKASSKTHGTGLGLAISKQLVELHKGTMGFESEYGVGSSFWFVIPQSETTAQGHTP